jgi:hypothetical protein
MSSKLTNTVVVWVANLEGCKGHKKLISVFSRHDWAIDTVCALLH